MRTRITSPDTAQATGRQDPAGRPEAPASRPGPGQAVPTDGALAALTSTPARKAPQAASNVERRSPLAPLSAARPVASPSPAPLAASQPPSPSAFEALELELVQLLGSTNGPASHLAERLEALGRQVEAGVSLDGLAELNLRADAILQSAIHSQETGLIDETQCRHIANYVTALRQKAGE
jgi:hypothetical protein